MSMHDADLLPDNPAQTDDNSSNNLTPASEAKTPEPEEEIFNFFAKSTQEEVKLFLQRAIDRATQLRGVKHIQVARHIGNTPPQFSKKLNNLSGNPFTAIEVANIAKFCGFNLDPLLRNNAAMKHFFQAVLNDDLPEDDDLRKSCRNALVNYMRRRNRPLPVARSQEKVINLMLERHEFGNPTMQDLERSVADILEELGRQTL